MPKIAKMGVGMTDMATPKLTRKELTELLRAEFPEMFNAESGYQIEKVWHGGAVVSTAPRCGPAAHCRAQP
jgi:hypothetical protein